jgi:hypothetical protein
MYKYTNIILLTTLISFVTIVVTTSMAWGADISSCTLKKIPDEQNYCKESFAGSATFCDMIKNGEKKRECQFMVVKIQRDNAYQLKKYEPPKSEEDNQRFAKKK